MFVSDSIFYWIIQLGKIITIRRVSIFNLLRLKLISINTWNEQRCIVHHCISKICIRSILWLIKWLMILVYQKSSEDSHVELHVLYLNLHNFRLWIWIWSTSWNVTSIIVKFIVRVISLRISCRVVDLRTNSKHFSKDNWSLTITAHLADWDAEKDH